MSSQQKPKSQDWIGLVLCAIGGLAVVSICLSAFGGKRPTPRVEALLEPVVQLQNVFGTPAALLFGLGLVGIGVWAFLGSSIVRFGRPLFLLAGTTLGVSFFCGVFGRDAGGVVGDFVRVNAGLAGKLSAGLVGAITLLLTWRPGLLVPRVDIPDLSELGSGTAQETPPVVKPLRTAEEVGPEEAEMLAAPRHPAAPPPFVDVRLEGGVPKGANALAGSGRAPSVPAPPMEADADAQPWTHDESSPAEPLDPILPDAPSWASTASWEAPTPTEDIVEEVEPESKTAWAADPEEYARTLAELEKTTTDAEDPYAVDVATAYEDTNDPVASAARARSRFTALTARSEELAFEEEPAAEEEKLVEDAEEEEELEEAEDVEFEDEEEDDVEYEEEEEGEEEEEEDDEDVEYEEEEEEEEEDVEYEDEDEEEEEYEEDEELDEDEEEDEEVEYEEEEESEDDEATDEESEADDESDEAVAELEEPASAPQKSAKPAPRNLTLQLFPETESPLAAPAAAGLVPDPAVEEHREVVLEPQPAAASAGVEPTKPAPAAISTEEPTEDLVQRAGALVLDENRVAVSMLQRRFELDFDQACGVLDELQQRGLIGPYKGGRTRDILLSREDWLALSS